MPPLLLAAAFAADLLFGDPRQLPHPVVGIGRLIRGLEALLYERIRPRRFGGVLLVVLTLLATGVLARGVLTLADRLHPLLGLLAAGWLAWTCLAVRELHRQSALVVSRLAAGDLPGARAALGMIVGRDTGELDEQGILRACIETVAENSSDGIVAPLFYLGLGGPLGGVLYKAASTMDSMVGYKNARYRDFGWAAARLDDLLNWLPARLTALLMVACCVPLGLDAGGAWCIARRDGRKHASPNAGLPEAAAAGALAVQLGGPACYFGRWQDKPTFGDAGRPLTVADYRRMVYLMYLLSTAALLLAMAMTMVVKTNG
ncbi:MAG: cobalamin biosynthesis protein CobD [Deltaproteobacteria bacterium]|nr:MAG: cobalamin biosynthesis protein CobD [Deltaproteobacteria bacterium]